MIGIHRISFTESRKAEGLFYCKRNKGIPVFAFGYEIFIDRKHDDVFKIECTGFKHAHYLQSFQRFAVKGDGKRPDNGREDFKDCTYIFDIRIIRP